MDLNNPDSATAAASILKRDSDKNSKSKTRLQVKKNMENSRFRLRVLGQSKAVQLGLNPIVILNRVTSNSTATKRKRKSRSQSSLSEDENKKKGGKRVPLSKICGYCHKTFSSGTVRLKHEMIHQPKKFHCPHSECSRSFTYAHSLQSHLNYVHSEERPHICEFPACTAAFKSLSNLKMHKSLHTGLRAYICPHSDCKKSFSQLGNLQGHLNCVHASGQNSFICPEPTCGKKMKTAKILKWHIRLYHSTNEVQIKCSLCLRIFKGMHNLNLHMRTHTKERPYSCTWPGCSKACATACALKSHGRVHSNQKPYICNYPNSNCQMAFRTSSERNGHVQRHHVGIKKHPCKFQGCHMSFFTTCAVQSHLRAHTKEKPHKCELCRQYYASSTTLKIHQNKAHKREEEKQFSCPHCSKKYFVESDLHKHLKCHEKIWNCKFPKCEMTFNSYKYLTTHYKEEHRGERILKCPKCQDRIFTRRRKWVEHIRRHNSPQLEEQTFAKYWCTFNTNECNKYFGSKTSHDIHMRSHTGERPFKCPVPACEKSCSQRGHLEDHVKRAHKQRARKGKRIEK